MAFLHDIEVALLGKVKAAVGQQMMVAGNRVEIRAAIGWPQIDALHNIAKRDEHLALIAVYDRKVSKNSTRWSPITLGTTPHPTGITSTLSNNVIPGTFSVGLTLGGTVLVNDAVSIILSSVSRETTAIVVTAGPQDTPATMAANLAAAVNADPGMSALVFSSVAGAVVTLSSRVYDNLLVTSNVGNIADEVREVARRLRQYQIVLWARTEEERIAIGNPLEAMIGLTESQFGLNVGDGTFARLLYVNDHDVDDDTLQDVLRRDFFVSVDYAITTRDVIYSVLAPVPSFSVE